MNKKNSASFCLDVIDYNKNRIVFHEKHRQEKAKTHSGLDDMLSGGFVNKNIPAALIDPDEIWQDLDNPKKRCYYKLEFYQDTSYSRISVYTKVVIGIWDKPWFIITAYQPQNIKEEAKGGKCLYRK